MDITDSILAKVYVWYILVKCTACQIMNHSSGDATSLIFIENYRNIVHIVLTVACQIILYMVHRVSYTALVHIVCLGQQS